MRVPDGFPDDMDAQFQARLRRDPLAIDPDTAERLLTGSLASADAPPEYRTVAVMVGALRREASAEELARGAETVGAITTAVRARLVARPPSRTRPRPRFAMLRSGRVAAIAAVLGVMSTLGLGVAGALGSTAQGVATDVLSKIGVTAATPNDQSGNSPNESEPAVATPTDPGRTTSGEDGSSGSSRTPAGTQAQTSTATTTGGAGSGTSIHSSTTSSEQIASGHHGGTVSEPSASTTGAAPLESAPNGGASGPDAAGPAPSPDPAEPPEPGASGPDGSSDAPSTGRSGAVPGSAPRN